MVDVGSMEGLFLETVPSDFVCKMFSLAIHYTFHYISHIFPNIITCIRSEFLNISCGFNRMDAFMVYNRRVNYRRINHNIAVV